MKLSLTLAAGMANVALAAIQGMDISHYQADPYNFAGAYSSGARFVFIKATEGTTYTDPSFSSNYNGATKAGFKRSGYHFARPDVSSGATQANYFLAHGGGWSGDGITLPGMLDLEYNPYGSTCYGLSTSSMVSWISDFVNTYHSRTSRYPIIYTSTSWWNQCTGSSTAFASTCPLNVARYSSSVGTLPAGWSYYTFWQYNDNYAYGGDSDVFNGDSAGLARLATG